MVRAGDAGALLPAADDAAAQRRFARSGWWTAQLSPAVFRLAADFEVGAAARRDVQEARSATVSGTSDAKSSI
jgi:hypothetical protein